MALSDHAKGYLITLNGVAIITPDTLLTVGARYLAAPEVAVLLLLETVICPYWVWLVMSEQPGQRTIVGGSIVLAALLVHALLRFRPEKSSVRGAGAS